jgi:hypothetical protein
MKSSTRKCAVLLFAVFCGTPTFAQTPFTYSLHVGDVRVYDYHQCSWQTDVHQVLSCSHAKGYLDSLRVYFTPRSIGYWPGPQAYQFCDPSLKIDAYGILTEVENNLNERWCDLYPISPPVNDSIVLRWGEKPGKVTDSVFFHVTRRFDTLLFQQPVRAFCGIIRPSPYNGDEQSFIIADAFGLIYWVNYLDTMRLQSAAIDGREYNRDTRRWNFLPLCTGNTYHYRRLGWWQGRDDSTWTSGGALDSTINGQKFYSFNLCKGTRLYRTDSSGVWEGERLHIPANASLGSVGDIAVVIDTATLFRFGKWRRTITTMEKSCGYQHTETWMEDIGLVSMSTYTMESDPIDDTLVYASICGEEFGTPVNVEHAAEAKLPGASLNQNYPNPSSAETTINFTLEGGAPQYVSLVVYDLHGRVVETLLAGMTAPGEHSVALNAQKLLPGLYYYQLRTKEQSLTKRMVVVKR